MERILSDFKMKLNKYPRNNLMYYIIVFNNRHLNNQILKEEKEFIIREFAELEKSLEEIISDNPGLKEKIHQIKQEALKLKEYALERAELWDKARRNVYYDLKKRTSVWKKPNEEVVLNFTLDDLNRLKELEKEFENKTGLGSWENVKNMMLSGEKTQDEKTQESLAAESRREKIEEEPSTGRLDNWMKRKMEWRLKDVGYDERVKEDKNSFVGRAGEGDSISQRKTEHRLRDVGIRDTGAREER